MKDTKKKNFEKFYLFAVKLYHKKKNVSMKLNFSSICFYDSFDILANVLTL